MTRSRSRSAIFVSNRKGARAPRRRLFLVVASLIAAGVPCFVQPAAAAPRMISFGYPNCVSCHVAPQGRGLLSAYGRGIDIAQSWSQVDITGVLLGKVHADAASAPWDGTFGPVLADVTATGRINRDLENAKTDPTASTLYRQIIFLGRAKQIRFNGEVGLRDSNLRDTQLSPNQIAVGGDRLFLKKLTLDWRIKENADGSGSELSIGRDYLPLGLQIDDYTTFILSLNRDGIYDFPLQAKYFAWNAKSLGAAFVFAPSFEEPSASREYGGGFMYERYPSPKLALGVQGLVGFADETDRARLGIYARWGISEKWALLAELDYTHLWNGRSSPGDGEQLTTFLQLHYCHTEWLVSSLSGNYAHSDVLAAGSNLFSARYTLSARINRNLTIGASYAVGDILRNLDYGQEAFVFAAVKF